MIQLIEDDGHLLTIEESRQYVEFKISEKFNDFLEFIDCKEIQNSSYWGDSLLQGTEKDYRLWIIQIAEKTFKL